MTQEKAINYYVIITIKMFFFLSYVLRMYMTNMGKSLLSNMCGRARLAFAIIRAWMPL